MAHLVLTVIGNDRPGLVSDLSAPIAAHGGSWERSQWARLAGKFAGILLVTVDDDRVERLYADLAGLAGLQVTVESTDPPADAGAARFTLDLVGADRPGLVAEISALLAAHGVSIEDLSTQVREAPMAGGMLFEAQAVLVAPAGATGELREALEAVAGQLLVDIALSESSAVPAR